MAAPQPFIYSPPRRNGANGFSTGGLGGSFVQSTHQTASYEPRNPNGPLVSFNRHPDSWGYVSAANQQRAPVKPMHPMTKGRVTTARHIQLAFRVLELLGATGTLICVICFTHMSASEAWVTRAVPGFDMLATLYAVYHLFRSAKARTPASSLSYHTFALFTDIFLIPLYVYLMLNSRSNLSEKMGTPGRWTTLLRTGVATKDMLEATWIMSLALAVLHFCAAVLSVWLVYTFRAISNLPPDLNPLEENLTSRRKTRHKHKSSDVLSSKHDSAVSFGASASSIDLANEKTAAVSFLETRTASDLPFSPHNPYTAEAARNLPAASLYSQPVSSRLSRVNMMEDQRAPSPSSSRYSSTKTVSDRGANDTNPAAEPPLPRKSSKRVSGSFVSSDNWYALETADDDDSHGPAISIIEEEREESESGHTFSFTSGAVERDEHSLRDPHAFDLPPSPIKAFEQFSSSRNPGADSGGMFTYQPLQMNPPTPPPATLKTRTLTQTHAYVPAQTQTQSHAYARARGSPSPSLSPSGSRTGSPAPASYMPLSDTSGNGSRVSKTPQQDRAGSPTKGKFYGDLFSAMQAVRGKPSPQQPTAPQYEKSRTQQYQQTRRSPSPPLVMQQVQTQTPTREPGVGMRDWLTVGAASEVDTAKRAARKKAWGLGSGKSKGGEHYDAHAQTQPLRRVDRSGRVVSRSGAEVDDDAFESVSLGHDSGSRRVSGKIAEEGRAGGGGWARRRISGKDVRQGLGYIF